MTTVHVHIIKHEGGSAFLDEEILYDIMAPFTIYRARYLRMQVDQLRLDEEILYANMAPLHKITSTRFQACKGISEIWMRKFKA